MRWLALDVGRRWVGMAVCDDSGSVVTPLSPLRFLGATALATAVARMAVERQLGGVVVGLPVTRAGGGLGEERVRRVVDKLNQYVDLPVETQDERGSSLEADDRLRDANVSPRRRRDLTHGVAAQIILERFLARRNEL